MHATDTPSIPWLVHQWRTKVARMTGQRAAEHLGVSRAALSQWETGGRRIPFERLRQLDEIYSACGILLDMARGVAAMRALPPRCTWDFNPSPAASNTWAWILSGGPHPISGIASQGFFYVPLTQAGSGTGTLLFLDESLPNPPVRIALDTPGWVTFGQGRPPEDLGVNFVAVRTDADWGLLDHPLMRRTFALFATKSGRAELLSLAARAGTPVTEILNAYTGVQVDPVNHGVPAMRQAPPCERERRLTIQDVRRLRRELNLTHRALADCVNTVLPARPVTEDHIARFEAGRTVRDDQLLLPARIDTALGLDGSLVLTAVEVQKNISSGTTDLRVLFPDFWVGPVWVQFVQPGPGPAVYELEWPPYSTRLRTYQGDIAHFRRSVVGQRPLRIRGPRGARVAAGIGFHCEARDINHLGWDLGPKFWMSTAWKGAVRIATRPRST